VAGELAVAPVESPHAVADAGGHGLACPFAFVAEPAGATSESGGAPELVDEGLPLVVELGDSIVVVAAESSVDLLVELGQPVAVAGLGPVVEDGVGTEPSRDREVSAGSAEGRDRHDGPGLCEQGVRMVTSIVITNKLAHTVTSAAVLRPAESSAGAASVAAPGRARSTA
jgi:hypothetical protein